jgi:hypothetical protein
MRNASMTVGAFFLIKLFDKAAAMGFDETIRFNDRFDT